MKKLKLNLEGKMLSKEQMKKISGGYNPCDEIPCSTNLWLCPDFSCHGGSKLVCSGSPPLGYGGCSYWG